MFNLDLGVDNDGHAYSAVFDPIAHSVTVRCATTAGDVSAVTVEPDGVGLLLTMNTGSLIGVQVNTEGVTGAYVGPGATPVHTTELGSTGLKIDGVLCDPSQPWPGS